MITLIVFSILWGFCGGTADTIKQLSDTQMMFVFLIVTASDLNILASRWR